MFRRVGIYFCAGNSKRWFARKNPVITSIMKNDLPITKQTYIDFKVFTGNEILYALTDCKKLKPGEISHALSELGKRKGAPENFDWNAHPAIKATIERTKSQAHKWPCKNITSLAHAYTRLNIKDPTLWYILEKHVKRIITAIEPIGLALCFNAFAGKGTPELFEVLVKAVPKNIRFMEMKDILSMIKGIQKANIQADELFTGHIYPEIKEKKKYCSVYELNEMISVLSKRTDFADDLKNELQNEIGKKMETKRDFSFGGIKKNNE
ncbi:unnamed protein product [Blepharisma stoltei]|uniref:Uncharacterized protein n=1 Tax=Blepharisma stoltei TaxID=1481888 RepID=A0AAU9IDY7_9CILI|nr:unnamed protein product [Blepharisma stoltei]